MLYEFLTKNRAELIDRCRLKVAQRASPKATQLELQHGIPLFLHQLIVTLHAEESSDVAQIRVTSGPSGRSSGQVRPRSEIGASASRHGRELSKHGFTVDQVVHDYGDLCQAVTELATERSEPIGAAEFGTLNRCLDDAIADAVTEFSYQHDALITSKDSHALNERLRILASDLRGHVKTAMVAITAIKAGNVGLKGATGAVLDLSLISLKNVIDRSLAGVRVTAGLPMRHQLMSVASLIAEVKISTELEARVRGCTFNVAEVDPELAVDADRDMLLSATGNLLDNAFRFARHNTEVTLKAYAAADRVTIEIADCCDGLPEGVLETLAAPLPPDGMEAGPGFGLTVCRRSVEANRGQLSARDIPGAGCVFAITLPRHILH